MDKLHEDYLYAKSKLERKGEIRISEITRENNVISYKVCISCEEEAHPVCEAHEDVKIATIRLSNSLN